MESHDSDSLEKVKRFATSDPQGDGLIPSALLDNRRMETTKERRKRRLKWLSEQHTLLAVAAKAGVNYASLDQVLKGTLLPPKADGSRSPRSLGDPSAHAIEDAYALGRGWFDLPGDEGMPAEFGQEPQPTAEFVTNSGTSAPQLAQSVSVSIPTLPYNETPTLEWEQIKLGKMEARFRTQMPDRSMDKGPRAIPKGRWLVFDQATSAPDNRRVIVRVGGDPANVHVRRVKEVNGGWLAKPDDPDFDAFDSRQVQLEVIALLHHVEEPDEG